jgi:hypothetical protein
LTGIWEAGKKEEGSCAETIYGRDNKSGAINENARTHVDALNLTVSEDVLVFVLHTFRCLKGRRKRS